MARNSKERMLEAAEAIVREEGARQLTLDAVAERCQMSKGGVLHHFRTKQSLLKAMLARMMNSDEDLIDQRLKDYAGQPNAQLRARIEALFAFLQDEDRLSRSMLAALAEDPSLLEPVREKDQITRDIVREESQDSDLAQLLLFAARGLFLSRVLGVTDSDDPDIQSLHQRIVDLTAHVGCVDKP
ncbi:TetR/AcrR family transcriptional regulator [Marinobacteraceae bacterium S3BR75-40.1]